MGRGRCKDPSGLSARGGDALMATGSQATLLPGRRFLGGVWEARETPCARLRAPSAASRTGSGAWGLGSISEMMDNTLETPGGT